MTSGVIQNYMQKNLKKMAASGERARERHFIRPLARPLVGELVLTARSIGARERNVDPSGPAHGQQFLDLT